MRADSRTQDLDVSGNGRSVAQIKDRQRVRDLAEVYTNEREVSAMLDLVADMFPADSLHEVDSKFLEPACGSGNFLEEILRRKLRPIQVSLVSDVEMYEHWLLRALASIYGVDICAENVEASRGRLIAVLEAHYASDATDISPSPGFKTAAQTIVETNVLRADMLADAGALQVIDYQPADRGCFARTWTLLDESSASRQSELFDIDEPPERDEVPVHYSKLAESPRPIKARMAGPAKSRR